MGTHDEETYRFFQNTGVTSVLFPRAGVNEQASIVHRNTTDRIFTHHQKTARLFMRVRSEASSADGSSVSLRTLVSNVCIVVVLAESRVHASRILPWFAARSPLSMR